MLLRLAKEFIQEVRELDQPVVWLLFLGGLLLCCDFYFDTFHTVNNYIMPWLPWDLHVNFVKNALSTFSCFFILMFIPCLIIKFGFKENLSDYGLFPKNPLPDIGLGITLYLIMLPMLVLITYAQTSFQSFHDYYPMYTGHTSELKILIAYEVIYGLYFVGWEFFFRGFLLFGAEKKFGMYSIFLWASLFAAMHFGKPGLKL